MLKKCCCCFDLRLGSILIGAFRLIHWLIIFLGGGHIMVQLYSQDNGLFRIRARATIEQNIHVLILILVISFFGIVLECLLLDELRKRKFKHLRLWYAMTLFSLTMSVLMAGNFILSSMDMPLQHDPERNFFSNAMCALFHIVFYFVNEYELGPRLTPLYLAFMILVHAFLPLMHAYSFYVVYSYMDSMKDARYRERYLAEAAGGNANANAPALQVNGQGAGNGSMLEDPAATPMPRKCGKLCQNCQIKQQGMNGTLYRCGTASPMVKPFETTC